MTRPYRTRLAKELGVIQLRGVGVPTFLQGYLTTDADQLQPHSLQGTAICTIKGRVLATLFGRTINNGMEFVLSRDLVESTCDYFSKYLIFSKIEIENCSNTRSVVAYLGTPPEGVAQISHHQGLWVVDDPQPLQDEHTLAEWQAAGILASLPFITQKTSAKFLPQMLNLEELGWLNFAKGCYLGQEVIARVQHRGEVKRQLVALRWEGLVPEVGLVLQPQATVIQSAQIRTRDGTALAVAHKPLVESYQAAETQFTQI